MRKTIITQDARISNSDREALLDIAEKSTQALGLGRLAKRGGFGECLRGPFISP
jgi:hypothetical protein